MNDTLSPGTIIAFGACGRDTELRINGKPAGVGSVLRCGDVLEIETTIVGNRNSWIAWLDVCEERGWENVAKALRDVTEK